MEKIPSSLSLSLWWWLVFPSLSPSRFISHSLSLSLALTLLLMAHFSSCCGVRSPSISLTSRPFSQGKANLTKQWLGTDEANCSPVVWEQFARRSSVKFCLLNNMRFHKNFEWSIFVFFSLLLAHLRPRWTVFFFQYNFNRINIISNWNKRTWYSDGS